MCNKTLLGSEILDITPYSCCCTCKEHKKYDEVILIEIIQKRLGIIKDYSDEMKKCDICNEQLSEENLNSLEDTDALIVCPKHIEARKWQQLQVARQWFEFKSENPDANYNYESIKSRRSFSRWRKKAITHCN